MIKEKTKDKIVQVGKEIGLQAGELLPEGKHGFRMTTVQLLALGFLGIIIFGSFLLWLPISNTAPIPYIDALFMSTTCVCVTGLATVVPAYQFTLFGQGILLILIQVGGLGVMACMSVFFLLTRKRVTIRERMMIAETYGADSITGIVLMMIRILKGTFLVEGLGAILFMLQFVPEYGVVKGVWFGVFHSISAFCNAGVDLLGDGSFTAYTGNVIINLTTMMLVVVSGLGFPVWFDLSDLVKGILHRKDSPRRLLRKMKLHSKIVLFTTTVLLVGGAILIFLFEFRNSETLGQLPLWQKVMAACFQSVTTRTAGFATISQSGMHDSSKFISIILMFIGGSPAGTAGGIKTTSIAILVLVCIAYIKGGRDAECYGRRIPLENVRAGFCITFFAICILGTGITLLCIVEPEVEFMKIVYEATSAVATVGLTADLTSELHNLSRLIIIAMMYLGRIGPISLALAFTSGKSADKLLRNYVDERIVVG